MQVKSLISIYCPPLSRKRGDIKSHSSVRLSVRLSVRPSVCHENFNLGHNFCTFTGRALIVYCFRITCSATETGLKSFKFKDNMEFCRRAKYGPLNNFRYIQANLENCGPPLGNKFDPEVGQMSPSRSRQGTIGKVLSQRIHMPSIKALPVKLQKLWPRLKFSWQTDGQTDERTNEI